MAPQIIEKEKEVHRVAASVVEKTPVLDLEAAQALQVRRLQEEAEVREKKMLAALEVRYDTFYRQLEASFAEKEKKLIDELQAGYVAERARIEQAAFEREKALLDRLASARQQIFVVIVLALLSVAAIWNYRVKPKDAVAPALVPVSLVDQGQVLYLPLPEASTPAPVTAQGVVAAPVPDLVPAQPVLAEVPKKGNGGNFSGGRTSGK